MYSFLFSFAQPDQSSSNPSKKGIYAALAGTVLVALCCFTPILVILLGAVSLASLTPYLDFVLLPALVLMIIITVSSYIRWRKAHSKPEDKTL